MNITNSIFLLAIVAMPTAGHMLSAYVHNWPGRDCQQMYMQCRSRIISVQMDADARHMRDMCSVEL